MRSRRRTTTASVCAIRASLDATGALHSYNEAVARAQYALASILLFDNDLDNDDEMLEYFADVSGVVPHSKKKKTTTTTKANNDDDDDDDDDDSDDGVEQPDDKASNDNDDDDNDDDDDDDANGGGEKSSQKNNNKKIKKNKKSQKTTTPNSDDTKRPRKLILVTDQSVMNVRGVVGTKEYQCKWSVSYGRVALIDVDKAALTIQLHLGRIRAHDDHRCGFSRVNCGCAIDPSNFAIVPPTTLVITCADQKMVARLSSDILRCWSKWHKGGRAAEALKESAKITNVDNYTSAVGGLLRRSTKSKSTVGAADVKKSKRRDDADDDDDDDDDDDNVRNNSGRNDRRSGRSGEVDDDDEDDDDDDPATHGKSSGRTEEHSDQLEASSSMENVTPTKSSSKGSGSSVAKRTSRLFGRDKSGESTPLSSSSSSSKRLVKSPSGHEDDDDVDKTRLKKASMFRFGSKKDKKESLVSELASAATATLGGGGGSGADSAPVTPTKTDSDASLVDVPLSADKKEKKKSKLSSKISFRRNPSEK